MPFDGTRHAGRIDWAPDRVWGTRCGRGLAVRDGRVKAGSDYTLIQGNSFTR